MNYNEGFWVSERGADYQIQNLGISVIPTKPIPTRFQSVSGEKQAGKSTNQNHYMGFQEDYFQEIHGTSACPDLNFSVDQIRGDDSFEAAWRNRNYQPIYSEILMNSSSGWNNIPFPDLLTSAKATTNSRASSFTLTDRERNLPANKDFFSGSYSQINNNLQHQSASSNMLNSNCPSQIPHYGFPASHPPSYDLSSLSVYSGPISVGFEPATPNKGKIMENGHFEVANIGIEDQGNQVQKPQYEAVENTCLTEMNSYHLPPAMDSSSFVPSNPINESQQLDRTMEQDVELDTHETQRKQRRKKHRPKIAIEGKTKMSPRSKTPKKAENPAGKRKYVRRKGINSTANASIDQGKDKEDPTWEPAKSCKRSLAFDSEVQVRDIRNGINLNSQKELSSGNVESSTKYPWKFNLNSEKQAQNLFAGLNSVKHTNSSLQNIQDLNNSIVQNSPARIAFDLNETSTQMINEYLSLPDKQSKDSMVGSGKSTATGTENGYSHLPQQINAGGIESVTQTTGTAHSVSHSTLTSQNYSNCRTEVLLALEQVRGTKREYCHMVDKGNPNSMNLVGDLNSTPIYQEQNGAKENQTNSSKFSFFFPHIYKRKRTGKGQNAVTSGTLPSKTTEEDTGGRTTMYRQSDPSGNDFATQVKKGQSALQFHNDIDTTETMNQGSIVSGHQNVHSLSIGHNFRLQNVCTDFLSHMETISGSAHDKLPSSGFMLNFGAARKITKARSKGLTRVRDLASLTAIMECKYSPTPAKTGKRSGRRQRTNGFGEPQASMKGLTFEFANMTKKRRSRRAPRLVKSVSYSLTNELHSYKNQVVVYDYRQSPVKIAGPSTVQKLYMDPIDEIVQKLNRLDMNSGSNGSTTQEKNALVPYKMVNAMIPYEGAFDYIKRRKPRAKVDLDPETDRVWKLLMGKECSEGLDGTEVDKEKWWEEERRVFQGRADSFIARMHLVQGDRRFTRWKGSVVDSVVGVFLTQNVSDHLSSSAFMSLAARFPLHSTSNREKTEVFVEEPEISIMDSYDSDQCYEKLSASDEGSITLQEPEHVEGKEVVDESFGSNVGSINLLNGSKGGQQLTFHRSEENANETEKQQCLLGKNNGAMDDIVSSQSSVVSTDSPNCSSTPQTAERYITVRENSYSAEANDRRAQEDVFSSQNSSVSSQTSDSSVHQTTGRLGSYSDSNSETEDTIIGSKSNNFNKPNFVNLLHMAVMPPKDTLLEHGNHELGGPLQRGSSTIRSTESEFNGPTKGSISANADHFTYPSNVNLSQPEAQDIPSSNFDLHIEPGPIASEVDCLGESIEASTMPFLQTASKIVDANSSTKRSPALEMSIGAPSKPCKQPLHNSRLEDNHSLLEETPPPIGHEDSVGRGNNRMQKASSSLPDFPQGSITLKETMTMVKLQKISENKTMESNLQEQVASAENAFSEITVGPVKAKGRPAKEKQEVFDWDSLRKDAHTNFGKSERNQNNMDTLDYDAVRCADVGDIASSIRGRGMNNMLAERIKDFLNRVVRDHGSIDLEWLRDVPPDKAKDYLLSIRGLGLKSVECVRLLTLYHHAFPVDTNVGRIAVRLGWVPLQPLPESLQLHLLELYPMMESIQKYLWPRLCKLTKEKLYELHYQMITFGKVFCTKSKPNCNACPMRAECRHFASAFASARLALPGPEEKRIVASNVNNAGDPQPAVDIEVPQLSLPAADTQSMQLRLPERNLLSETGYGANQSEPIIEQPSTPETNSIEVTQSDIEDAFYEDPDEIPTINLNVEDFTLTLQNYMQENNMELLGNDMSKALVALNPEVASIPTHKLKNVSRLRTEHLVYELPDSHPLLVGRDRREPDDPCSYLLAIWTPGETADSIQPPERGCRLQGSGNLCDDETCFSCNGIREANSQIVRGTLLIPCRTAMKGSFPLNGTYFQVNEVFADHDSSLCPIPVPRSSIWNLPRRTVSFGTSVPSIFKGLTTEAIQSCFWRGFVCVRGFDQKTRAPRPLQYRFHMVASKMVKKEQEQPTGKK